MKFEWNVYYYDFTANEMKPYNVLSGFEKFVRDAQKYTIDKNEFAAKLKSEMMYHFWSKCEWEIVLTPWIGRKDGRGEKKIDVYDQLRLNWDHFVDYCWTFEFKEEL